MRWRGCPRALGISSTRAISLRAFAARALWAGEVHATYSLHLSKRPEGYLCNKLEINVWYGNPSARARF